MTAITEALCGYLPALLMRRISADPQFFRSPSLERFLAPVLIADLSDTTALAESLSGRGQEGAEAFSRILNRHLSPLIDVLIDAGGDIIKFAGDGLVATWPDPETGNLEQRTFHAARGALSVQEVFARLLREAEMAGEMSLRLRVGLGVGEAAAIHLSDGGSRAELVLGGDAVADAVEAYRQAGSGEVSASPSAWRLLRNRVKGLSRFSGAVRFDDVPVDERESVAGRSSCGPSAALPCRSVNEESFRAYVPRAVLSGAEVSADALEHRQWISESRRVSALFVGLPGRIQRSLAEAQKAMATVQAEVEAHGGAVARLSIDDKGPAILSLFGIPPGGHEDDAVRALEAGLSLLRSLADLHMRPSIGVATGRVFCCEIGNDRRREYTVVGPAVNLAARLMQTAASELLCDAETHDTAGSFVFSESTTLRLRGIDREVEVFRPARRGRRTNEVLSAPIAGREHELAVLRERMHRLVETRSGAVVVVEGEPGIGKSRLLAEAIADGGDLGVTALAGSGDALNVSTPYHSWRSIFSSIFELDRQLDSVEARRFDVLAKLEQWLPASASFPGGTAAAPLLNSVLPLEFPETPWTIPMGSAMRADNSRRLLIRLLRYKAHRRSLMFVLDDAQWMDSASWTLAVLTAQLVHPSLLLIAARSMGTRAPRQYRLLHGTREVEVLKLEGLAPEYSKALLQQCLGADSIDDEIVSFVVGKGRGNPFLTRELARALLEAGRVSVDRGRCFPAPGNRGLEDLEIPATVEGAVTARISRLRTEEQITLKVCSVLGPVFSFDMLAGVYPLTTDHHELRSRLKELLDLDFLRRVGNRENFVFKLPLVRDAAYRMMPLEQRLRVHRAVAEYLESHPGGDARSFLPLLAHHWSRSVDGDSPDAAVLDRAVECLEKAAYAAAADYAHREAADFLAMASNLELLLPCEGSGVRGRERRAQREFVLAEAKYRMGFPGQARDHLLSSLESAGHALPASRAALLFGLLEEALRQFLKRSSPSRPPVPAASTVNLRLERTARAHDVLAFLMLLGGERGRAWLANLRALNISESSSSAAVFADSCAMFAMNAGIVLGPAFARRYFDLAAGAALRAGDPSGSARSLLLRGIYFTGRADWDTAKEALESARRRFAKAGDLRWSDAALLQLGNLSYSSRDFAAAIEAYAEAYQRASDRGDAECQAWSYIGMACVRVLSGQNREALDLLDIVEEGGESPATRLYDNAAQFSASGTRALAYFQSGRFADAGRLAVAARSMLTSPLRLYHACAGYVGVAEVLLGLCERRSGGGGSPLRDGESASHPWGLAGGMAANRGWSGTRLAESAVDDLRRFARCFRCARPQALLAEGRLDWIRGKHAAALKKWKWAAAQARSLKMSYEEGLAHLELAIHSPVVGARDKDLERARELLEPLNAVYALLRVQEAEQASL